VTGKLKLTLNVLGSLQIVVDIAQVVQAQLNKAGFDVALNVQEQGRFIADWRASNFDGFVSLNGGNPDPDDYFGRTYQTGGATNVFKYSNPDLDKLLIAARATTDAAARKHMARRSAPSPAPGRPSISPTARCSLRCATTCRVFRRCPPGRCARCGRRGSVRTNTP
jgi:ABC-type transport system substrate-binding protein